VPADPNIGKGEGGGLANTRSVRKADGNGVKMFRKVRPYQQSTKEIVRYQRAVPPGTTTFASTETKNRQLTAKGMPTVVGCLSNPGEKGVKAHSTNP